MHLNFTCFCVVFSVSLNTLPKCRLLVCVFDVCIVFVCVCVKMNIIKKYQSTVVVLSLKLIINPGILLFAAAIGSSRTRLAIRIAVYRLTERRHQILVLRQGRFELFQLAGKVVQHIVLLPTVRARVGLGQYPATVHIFILRNRVRTARMHHTKLLQRRCVGTFAQKLRQLTLGRRFGKRKL